AQNMRNISRRNRLGFKGVSRQRSKWAARICVDGRRIYLGAYSTPEKAAAAYDEAARLYYGEFASTNEMCGLLPPRDPGTGSPDGTHRGHARAATRTSQRNSPVNSAGVCVRCQPPPPDQWIGLRFSARPFPVLGGSPARHGCERYGAGSACGLTAVA